MKKQIRDIMIIFLVFMLIGLVIGVLFKPMKDPDSIHPPVEGNVNP